EIPAVLVSDYDPESGCVWLNGTGRRLCGRWAKLLPSGVEAVERRIAALGSVASTSCLAYEGTGGPARAEAATSTALRKILNRAGLRDDRRVRPSSIRAGAGRRLYDETRDLQEVAHRLGLRSLDGVRQVIGLPEPVPDEPPAHRRRR